MISSFMTRIEAAPVFFSTKADEFYALQLQDDSAEGKCGDFMVFPRDNLNEHKLISDIQFNLKYGNNKRSVPLDTP